MTTTTAIDPRALISEGRKHVDVFDNPTSTVAYARTIMWCRANLCALFDALETALDSLGDDACSIVRNGGAYQISGECVHISPVELAQMRANDHAFYGVQAERDAALVEVERLRAASRTNLEMCPQCKNKSVRAKELHEGGVVTCTTTGCGYQFCY